MSLQTMSFRVAANAVQKPRSRHLGNVHPAVQPSFPEADFGGASEDLLRRA